MEKTIEELRENGQRIIDCITRGMEIDEDAFYRAGIKAYDYFMYCLDSIRDSYRDSVENKIALEFIDVDKEKNTLTINEDKLQRVAKEIDQKRIEGWRAKGEGVIENIIDYVNAICKDETKEEKYRAIVELLVESDPECISPFQSRSMGFILIDDDDEKCVPVISEKKLLRRAKGKNVEILREKLLNNEMSFSELDSILVGNGYDSVFYSVYEYGNQRIKEDECVEYIAEDTGEAEIRIYFNITKDNEPGKEDFYLKVTSIKRI